MDTITYKTTGICCKEIKIDVDNGLIKNVVFLNGCDGNLQGISKLVEGMPVGQVIERLRGVNCGGRGTSCPDQLAKALEGLL